MAVGTASAAIVGGLLSWIAVRRSLGVIFTGIVTLVFSLAFANLLLGQRDLTGAESGLIVTAAPGDLADDRGRRLLPLRRRARRLPDRLPRAPALAHRLGVPRPARRRDGGGAGRRRRRAVPGLRRDRGLGDDRPDGRCSAPTASGFVSPATYAFDHVDVRVLVLVAFGGLGTLLGPRDRSGRVRGRGRAAEQQPPAPRVFYGVFVIAIFLGFRRGVVQTVVDLFSRLVACGARSPRWGRRASRLGAMTAEPPGIGLTLTVRSVRLRSVDNTALLERLAQREAGRRTGVRERGLRQGPRPDADRVRRHRADQRPGLPQGGRARAAAPVLRVGDRDHPGRARPRAHRVPDAARSRRRHRRADLRARALGLPSTRTRSTCRSRTGRRWSSPTASTIARASSCSATSSSTRRTARGSARSSRSIARRRSTFGTASAG